MSAVHPLSNIQQELLKLYSSDVPEADLLHIRSYLAKYFAFKAIGEADRIWDEKRYTNETMNQWLNEDEVPMATKTIIDTNVLVLAQLSSLQPFRSQAQKY